MTQQRERLLAVTANGTNGGGTHADERCGGPDVAEHLVVLLHDLLGVSDVRHVHAGSDHVLQRAARLSGRGMVGSGADGCAGVAMQRCDRLP